MVFDRFAHRADLLLPEPAAQFGIGFENPACIQMMVLASVNESRIVVGGDCIDHVGVDRVVGSQCQAACDDRVDVVEVVCPVEIPVAGEYLPFDVVPQFGIRSGVGFHLFSGLRLADFFGCVE